MRIVLLHTRLSGYLAACLREFKRQSGAELLIYALPNQGNAPFDPSVFADLGEICNRRQVSEREMENAVRSFGADAILVSGWVDPGYVKVCRAMRKEGVLVIAGCDTQWKGNLRQHVAGLSARLHVQKAIDVLWVTGERQAVLGRSLGYAGERLWDGYYACDFDKFARIKSSVSRKDEQAKRSQSDPFFLYVGRYVPEKGIDTLLEAYRMYRERVENPWRLVCAGAGPLRESLVKAGAEDRGFVQPCDLPALMHSAATFVLPSRFEPWGVVAQEAAASGLPLILSDACGAGVHLLRDGFNGFLVPTGDSYALANAMVQIAEMNQKEREFWGAASFELSKQYTPKRWVDTLVRGVERF